MRWWPEHDLAATPSSESLRLDHTQDPTGPAQSWARSGSGRRGTDAVSPGARALSLAATTKLAQQDPASPSRSSSSRRAGSAAGHLRFWQAWMLTSGSQAAGALHNRWQAGLHGVASYHSQSEGSRPQLRWSSPIFPFIGRYPGRCSPHVV